MDPHLFIEIMGSYRRFVSSFTYLSVSSLMLFMTRGKDTCGDIDILITRPTSDGKTHVGVLRVF